MRILSQNGLQIQDFPYERTRVYLEKDGITIKGLFDGIIFELVEYSTEAKSRKAMEMLREEYTGIPNIRRMDDLYGRFKHTGKKDFELFIEHMILKKVYFQFPADDEVEV